MSNAAQKSREYVVGVSSEGRPTITLNLDEKSIPFNVWRDVARLAGKSHIDAKGHLSFEFLVPSNRQKAESVLKGALFVRKG